MNAIVEKVDLDGIWRGERYVEHRILILGESNWGIGDMTDAEYVGHWLKHPRFWPAQCPTCERVGGPKYRWDPLNNALTRMMIDWREPTDVLRRQAWSKIAFTNFVLRPIETLGANDRPIAQDWLDGARALPARLDSLRPRVCLLLDNPSKIFSRYAAPVLEEAGVPVVLMPHPTMTLKAGGYPSVAVRAEAWRKVLEASRA